MNVLIASGFGSIFGVEERDANTEADESSGIRFLITRLQLALRTVFTARWIAWMVLMN